MKNIRPALKKTFSVLENSLYALPVVGSLKAHKDLKKFGIEDDKYKIRYIFPIATEITKLSAFAGLVHTGNFIHLGTYTIGVVIQSIFGVFNYGWEKGMEQTRRNHFKECIPEYFS